MCDCKLERVGSVIKRLVIILLGWKTRVLSFVYGLVLPVQRQKSWILRGRPRIVRRRGSRIVIGHRFTACSQSGYNSLGVFQRVFIRTCMPNSAITIGDDVGMSGCTISAHKAVSIGNNVLIGSGALISDSDAHPLDLMARRNGEEGRAKPIAIEDDVFIGARAIVLKGVRIGRGAVIGAGAVVSKDVPPFSIAVGNPARVVRKLSNGVL